MGLLGIPASSRLLAWHPVSVIRGAVSGGADQRDRRLIGRSGGQGHREESRLRATLPRCSAHQHDLPHRSTADAPDAGEQFGRHCYTVIDGPPGHGNENRTLPIANERTPDMRGILAAQAVVAFLGAGLAFCAFEARPIAACMSSPNC
jgi:hypothetical protein